MKNEIAKLREDMALIQAAIEGKHIQWRRIGSGDWDREEGRQVAFNFVDYEYRIAPDVVYKIEGSQGFIRIAYWDEVELSDTSVADLTVTKGYWVEGEL